MKSDRAGLGKIRWVIFIVIALMLAFTLFGKKGLVKCWQMQRELDDTQRRIDRLRKENEILRNEVELLKKKDPPTIEKIAREELRLGRPKEETYLFVHYSSSARKKQDKRQ
jgi:cell division protein FtsL